MGITMAEILPSRFDPGSIEKGWIDSWDKKGYFTVDPDSVLETGKDPYVIVIPPPNVTAVLHIGHGLNNTIQDVLIRWRRMQGRVALWVPGTDHAGIATQNMVERQLAQEGITRNDLGRDGFESRVWDYVDKTGGKILEQLKTIGSSCDFERTRFTLDEGLSDAVREAFVRLYEKDLIYRSEYIINWCPRCLTALSNEEAESREMMGKLYRLRYPLAEKSWSAASQAHKEGVDTIGQLSDGCWYITLSTTRPETILGDTAIAVHPEDPRYVGLVGAEIELPLTTRTVRVIADDFVDPEFGSGVVKVTPAHDPNDFEIAQRSELEMLDIFTPEANLNDNVPKQFRGLSRLEGRKKVLESLQELDLLGESADHAHAVPHCYRCDTIVEPRLSLQWFVKMKPLAEPALQASRDGTITFTPSHWQKVYERWMEDINDWCISRQLWWGHRIPVWYCDDCGETIVARKDPECCDSCSSSHLTRDPDVLDTWFSSWLWPFSVFGWPRETKDLKAFYPTNDMVTAPEILFFWVARMIMSGYEFMGEAPFTQVYLHGTVRDKVGRKMSKSLGNGVDPMEVVDLFGSDALRFTLLSSSGTGGDIRLDHEDLESSFSVGRNFANKLWNAGRFALMRLGGAEVYSVSDIKNKLEIEDKWILSRLQETIDEVTHGLADFRFHEVTERLYHFIWGDFADWYLEMVKARLVEEEGESYHAARSTLVTVLDGVLRLIHPIMPFVSSELWVQLPFPRGGEKPETLTVARWPEANQDLVDQEAKASLNQLQELITQVRSLRKEYGVGEKSQIDLQLIGSKVDLSNLLVDRPEILAKMAGVKNIHIDGKISGSGAHAVLKNGTEVFIPLEGVIDLVKERERLNVEILRLEGLVEGARQKLSNDKFLTGAPADVVEREKLKQGSFLQQLSVLNRKIESLTDV